MHGMNTALVAGAGALQISVPPHRVWRQTITLDLVPHVALVIVGVLAATVIVDQPLLLPLVGMPLYLMHRAVKQSIRLREDTERALSSLVDIVELRDPYTAGHSRRVATTARLIAERLGLSAEEADLIESAGRVHDLGKVAIDPAVLLKPTKLTIEEQRELERHASLGADVIANFATYRQGTRLVRHHHERWDGRGYPDGLAGEAIPLGARILAVADTFDALTSDRPYRKGMSAEKATAILREGSGSQWDAAVVDALLSILAEQPEQLPFYHQSPDAQTPRASHAAA
jgi:HD-GYP domain-containing protein (c-di-GMP phosphodiesterase class II)